MKKDKSLNDEQNLAVYSRDHSILVSAPAGSGKTKILVNRILSLIEDDHINVNELLVLTFTKAAALEMKQRLTQQLNTKILTCDPALKSHLEKQKLLLNDAYITNFHSFCSDILSQYGYMINIDSQFQILENTDVIKQKILEQCLDQWVKDPAFMHFYRCHHTEYHFQNFKNIIFQLDNLSHTVYEFDQYIQKVKYVRIMVSIFILNQLKHNKVLMKHYSITMISSKQQLIMIIFSVVKLLPWKSIVMPAIKMLMKKSKKIIRNS